MFKTQKSTEFQTPSTPLTRLRRRWWIVTLLFGLTLFGMYMWLPPDWHRQNFALRWATQAGLGLAYLLWQFRRGLPDNHRQGATELLPTLGLGNSLTLLRGLAIGLLAGFLFLPPPTGGLFAWTPAILYTIISILDYLDGYAARITDHATKLGERLDGICDALGLLIAVSLLVNYGQLPAWFLLVGLTTYLFRLGLWQRERRRRPIFDLPPSRRRRMLAGFQMAFISVLLWPFNYPIPAATLAGIAFSGPVLAGFGRDWLVVSGRFDPTSTGYRLWRNRLSALVDAWLPPLLRGGVALLSLIYLLPIALNPARRYALLLWPGSPNPALTANLLALLALIATLMLALGLLARLAALGLLAPIIITLLTDGLHGLNGGLLIGVILLMLLGSGNWSLWRLDDVWVTFKAGKAR